MLLTFTLDELTQRLFEHVEAIFFEGRGFLIGLLELILVILGVWLVIFLEYFRVTHLSEQQGLLLRNIWLVEE